ncbi:2Fe-2S iron-sulfur cluster binding domain-containing protein [Hymenobacter busanensis]|uniref:2Fe-2S iron-sulfur cluster binding domain-containing protein n=1 Tax=Hymenobacter busanensis TaxID=2607656 RepID=A0A7L4ZWM1_9BACT|nr:FAD binding domain-containing protein [Hymenobacter busanensis]KAA9332235.1 2Fe-2S iron-sulfur cluster binding domain-containing protein [Hymenobacter busanensis]QHJ07427.1 2Fe-2S iron-sulfur cluster binding domain-containing protein [Hymenobacter busanensis]
MLQFYLNDQLVRPTLRAGSTLLDYVRYHQHLTGTKIGCREGDCGACTMLVGELQPDGAVRYQSMTSCLTPLGNAHGRHIVTVEGISQPAGLTPVQEAIVAEGGTQCGFCTPGFVMSLTGHCLGGQATDEAGRAAIDGNICRCTGYKSLERATDRLTAQLLERDAAPERLAWLVEQGFVPAYFQQMPAQLAELRAETVADVAARTGGQLTEPNGTETTVASYLLGGGTDLLVQRADDVLAAEVQLLYGHADRCFIRETPDGRISLGAATTVEDLRGSELMQRRFPRLRQHLKLVSSTPIRNMATVAGNFVNASPIGDLTIFFLALDAELTLQDAAGRTRQLPLRELYRGYKQLNRQPDEQLVEISFRPPAAHEVFNFEKVSKRTHLDIASVNSAARLRVADGRIQEAHLSGGGVGPTPLYLRRTSAFLAGKDLNPDTLRAANEVAQQEISPIGDARGTEAYKRLLLRQLLFAHFLEHFPAQFALQELV